jgi:hypothetical protein
LTPRRWPIALGFALAYLYAFPFFAALRSANEVPRIVLTQEIVDRGSFRLDGRWAEVSRGSTFDVATTPDGHHYSNKAPGVSFVGVPAYLVLKGVHAVIGGEPTVAEVTWAVRVTSATLPALIFLPFFLGLARRFAPGAASDAALLAVGLGSMLYPYALLYYSHALSAACAGGAFVAAVAAARGTAPRPAVAALAAGFLAGAAVLVDYQAALAALAVGVYLVALRPRLAPVAALGAVPPAALLAFYHTVCFGSPLRTGYSFAVDVAHKQGVLGIVGPNRDAMGQALVAPDNGLLVLMPWTLLVLVGVAAGWRRARAETLVCAAVVAVYVLFIGSLVPEFGRAGWSVGPRYIAVAIPFFGWLAAAGLGALEGRPVWRTGAHALVAAGVIVMVVAGTTYPHWPISFSNPLYEVSFRALGEGLAPHSLGTLLGLRGLPSLLPLYAVVAALTVSLLGVRRTTLAALALAAGIVWAYGFFPGGTPPEKWRFVESTWEPR